LSLLQEVFSNKLKVKTAHGVPQKPGFVCPKFSLNDPDLTVLSTNVPNPISMFVH